MSPQRRSPEKFIVDWSLFLSAYAPMFAIAAVKWEGLALKCAVMGVFILFAAPMTLILMFGSHQEPTDLKFTRIEVSAELNAGFLATYLLPFLTTDTPSSNSLIAYGLFIWIVGLILTRGRVANVNPLLYLFGYHIANADAEGKRYILIARDLPEPLECVKVTRLLQGSVLLRINIL